MEATEGLLDKIVPPRLEDAGLEDCALPPDAIKEAFLKAATAVRSIISLSDDEDDGHCVNDPWPTVEDSAKSDVLVGITEGTDSPPGGCDAVKGGCVPDSAGDDVAVVGEGEDEQKADEVVGATLPEGGKACVDGLQGLKIGEKGGEVNNKDKKLDSDEDEDEEEEKEKERPILAEGFV